MCRDRKERLSSLRRYLYAARCGSEKALVSVCEDRYANKKFFMEFSMNRINSVAVKWVPLTTRMLFAGLLAALGGSLPLRADSWTAGSSPVIATGESVTISTAQPPVTRLTDNGALTFTAGGSATITGSLVTAIGSGSYASGTLTLSGGALTNSGSGYFVVGYLGATGSVEIASGAVLAITSSRLRIAGNEDGSRELPTYGGVSVSGLLSAPLIEFTGFFPSSNQTPPYAESGLLALNAGGVVEAGQLQKNDLAASTLLFNGGTLRASQNSTSFISGGGVLRMVIADDTSAVFDTNGKTVMIAPMTSPYDTVLTLSGETNETATGNGGLVKTGEGTLVITLPAACNTFTGAIEVVQGTLDIGRPLATSQTVLVHAGATFVLRNTNDAAKVSVSGGGNVLYAVGTDTADLDLTAINSIYYDDRLGSPATGSATLSGPLIHSASVGAVGSPFRLIGLGGTLNLTNTGLEAEAVQVEGSGTFNFMGDRTYTSADDGKITLTDGGYRQNGTFSISDASAATPAAFAFTAGRFSVGGNLDVGVAGYGSFIDANASATATCSRIRIGGGTGYAGSFTQTTGMISISSESHVGFDGGTGTLTVAGGQFLSSADLRVAANPGDTDTRSLRPGGFVTVSNALLRCNTFYLDSWWPTNGTATNIVAGQITLQPDAQAEVNQVVKNDDPIGTILFDGGLLRARAGISGLLWVSTANGTLRVIASPNEYATLDTGGNAVSLYGGSGKLVLTGAGGFMKLGSGLLTFSATQSSYTGDTVIAAGTLRLGSSNVIPDGTGKGDVQIATNAVLDLYGKSETINRLIGYGSVISTNGPTTLGVLANGSSSTWDHDWFSGAISIDKQGTGTLTVAASGIFATNATASSGSLVLASSEGYPYYRFKIEGVKNYVAANSMQFSELALYNGDTDVTSNRMGFAIDPNGASFPSGEGPDKVLDGIVYTNTTTKNKWLDFRASTGYVAAVRDRVWIRIDFPSTQKITRYNWATGNDAQERDPATWRLQGSYSGTNWVDIDVQSNFVATSTRNAWVTTDGFPVSSQNSPDAVASNAVITVKAGANLTLDGVSETMGGLAGLGTVTLADNANLILANATNASVYSGSISGTGTLTKVGNGTQCLWNTNTFSGTIRVDGGTLSVLGGGSPSTWFRFTIKKNRSDTITVTQLSELTLTSADGTRWNQGLTQGTATNALLQGQFATPVTYATGSGSEGPDKLFDNSTSTKWCLTGNTPNPTNASTYRVIVMRLTNTISEIVSYNLCTANDVPDRDPTQWTLEASTNGSDWAEVDARSGIVPPTDRYTWYNGGTPFTVTSRAVGAGDADVIPDSAVVEVAAGATLCVSNGTDVIGAILVDLSAGAGTITQLTAKPDGTLYLVHASGSPTAWTIPLTLGTVTNPDALKTWTVYVDGVELGGYTLVYDVTSGQFRLVAKGLLILMR